MTGSVVLRGQMIDLDSDVGQAFCIDCCRFCEQLLDEMGIREKYEIGASAWLALANNRQLLRAIERTRAGRVRDGSAAREMAQAIFLQAPSVLGTILTDSAASPRHRIEAARELRAVAAPPANAATAGEGTTFKITINLTGDGSEGEHVETFDKPYTPKPAIDLEGDSNEAV